MEKVKRTLWFKDKIFYQIWPRSFKDGNGDGMGDLWGVIEKLDYIKELGCDGIWFSPLYVSPGADCGYDIADYYNIAPEFGGMEAFDKMLSEAHKRDLKVIMDLVVNHSSDENEWFQKSRRRIDPYTDYYVWRDSSDPKAACEHRPGKLPNNWDSMFEGKAWEWDEVRQQYYLHLFAIKQPDLNMDNPVVREEVKRILKFWLDKGVDGFREDVITFISKREGLPNDWITPVDRGIRHYNHGPHIHEYLQEFRRDVLDHYDCMTLAEAPLVFPKRALDYIGEKNQPSNDIDMMIQFECECADCLFIDYMPTKFSLRRMKRSFSSWQNKLAGKAWNMLYIENHDHPRIISRYGSEKYRAQSGSALAASYLFQQGTPFIYQGQELGMVNWKPASTQEYEDVQTLNFHPEWPEEKRLKMYHRASRDSARTLMQWDDSECAGFGCARDKAWFALNDNYTEINAKAEAENPNSLLNFYKKAIALRKSLPVVSDGQYKEFRPLNKHFYIYSRENGTEKILVIASFSDKKRKAPVPSAFDLEKAELLLTNYPHKADGQSEKVGQTSINEFDPYEVRVYRWSKS